MYVNSRWCSINYVSAYPIGLMMWPFLLAVQQYYYI